LWITSKAANPCGRIEIFKIIYLQRWSYKIYETDYSFKSPDDIEDQAKVINPHQVQIAHFDTDIDSTYDIV
jgi:hypothetical protein